MSHQISHNRKALTFSFTVKQTFLDPAQPFAFTHFHPTANQARVIQLPYMTEYADPEFQRVIAVRVYCHFLYGVQATQFLASPSEVLRSAIPFTIRWKQLPMDSLQVWGYVYTDTVESKIHEFARTFEFAPRSNGLERVEVFFDFKSGGRDLNCVNPENPDAPRVRPPPLNPNPPVRNFGPLPGNASARRLFDHYMPSNTLWGRRSMQELQVFNVN
ncbi:hypothetical protein BDR26DRAFT_417540 [Obelidium mucronatum]|nr:hypothetical protein BDR26DRAFT_417540 [Obelidium mucronatum]